MSAERGDALLAPIKEVLDRAAASMGETSFLAPGGVLEVPVDVGEVRSLRLELPGQFLHLQSIGLETSDGSDAAQGATVSVSSWYGRYEAEFSPARLFDFDHPTGTTVHTERDDPAWVEVRFARPVRLRTVRLRNVPISTATRAARLKVTARTRFRRHVLHDGAVQDRALRQVIAAVDGPDLDPVARQLLPVVRDTLRGAYPSARKALDSLTDLTDADRRAFRALITDELLASRELMWTVHGPQRCFRFWGEQEKAAYVRFAREVTDALQELTPHVCFGFGAVLSVVRDHALIPHDDDLDVIVGFEPHEAATLDEGLDIVSAFLTDRGFAVRGTWSAHRQVARTPQGKHIDVFVGLFEGDAISWYPGTRGALHRDTMYPTTLAPLLGVDCPIPARPEVYLETLYGPSWQTPDPHFAHRWDRSAYADLTAGNGVS